MPIALRILALLLLAHALPARAQDDDGPPEPAPGERPVIIVGGGFCGLAAATMLAAEGVPVLVLEREALPGGRTSAGHRRSIIYPRGTARCREPEYAMRALFRATNVTRVEIPGPAQATWLDGKVYPGATIFDGWGALPLSEKERDHARAIARCIRADSERRVFELGDVPPALRRLDGLTVRQYLDEACGGAMAPRVAALVDAFLRGAWGGGLDEVSALAALGSLYAELDADPADDREELPDLEAPSGYFTTERTLAHLVERMAEALGGRFWSECEATSVTETKDGVEVAYRTPGAPPRTVAGCAAILAVPAPVAHALAPGLPAPKRKALAAIRYVPFATVTFFSERPLYDASFALVAPGLVFPLAIDAGRVPRARQTGLLAAAEGILGVRVPCDDALFALSDEDLAARVLADLEKAIPGARAAVKGRPDVARFLHGIPVFGPGAAERARALHAPSGRIVLAGDYLVAPTIEGALVSAERAAREAADIAGR